jgi:hypothetical protein
MKMILRFLLISFISILFACRRDNVEQSPFDKTAYPVNIGNWWRYKVVDTFYNKVDTLLLKIISKTTNNDLTIYKCHLEQRNQIVDSATMTLSGTELSYQGLNGNYSYFGDFKLKFPFNQGESWNNDSAMDVTKVLAYTMGYDVLGKKYNVFSLQRIVSSLGYRMNQTLVVSKGIGIISQNLDLFNGGPLQRKIYQLIDYDLK